MSTATKPRFPNALNALHELKRGRPELYSEVDLAIQMIQGTRPGIEVKYDALLLKLDRTYSSLRDQCDYWQEVRAGSKLFRTRLFAKVYVKVLGRMIRDVEWMRARNKDLIQAIHHRLGATEHAAERTEASLNESATQSPAQAVKLPVGCARFFNNATKLNT